MVILLLVLMVKLEHLLVNSIAAKATKLKHLPFFFGCFCQETTFDAKFEKTCEKYQLSRNRPQQTENGLGFAIELGE